MLLTNEAKVPVNIPQQFFLTIRISQHMEGVEIIANYGCCCLSFFIFQCDTTSQWLIWTENNFSPKTFALSLGIFISKEMSMRNFLKIFGLRRGGQNQTKRMLNLKRCEGTFAVPVFELKIFYIFWKIVGSALSRNGTYTDEIMWNLYSYTNWSCFSSVSGKTQVLLSVRLIVLSASLVPPNTLHWPHVMNFGPGVLKNECIFPIENMWKRAFFEGFSFLGIWFIGLSHIDVYPFRDWVSGVAASRIASKPLSPFEFGMWRVLTRKLQPHHVWDDFFRWMLYRTPKNSIRKISWLWY